MTMFRPAYAPGIAFEHGLSPCQLANVLDGLSLQPTGAYSSRRLLSTYMGPALQVVRDSDTHTLDIGFDANCNLDSAAMLAFCSGTNCQVAKWYDQTGNGNDLVGYTGGSNGPNIVTSGALSATIGGHVANTTGNNWLINNSGGPVPQVGATEGALFVVGKATSGGTTHAGTKWGFLPTIAGGDNDFSGNSNAVGISFAQTGSDFATPSIVAWRYQGNEIFAHIDMSTVVSYTYGTAASFVLRYKVADSPNVTKGYVNGGTPSVDSNTASNNAPLVNFTVGVGGNFVRTPQFQGVIAEVLVFDHEPSLAESNILGANMATYWGLPAWGTISV